MLAGLLKNAIGALAKSLSEKKIVPWMKLVVDNANEKIKAPKWYIKKPSTIEPGLIEVSVAITAATVVLPSLISLNTPEGYAIFLKCLCFLGQAVSAFTSIYLLDRYAKNKGTKSIHILFDPLSDGPFFFLGWSIFLILIVFSLVVFKTK